MASRWLRWITPNQLTIARILAIPVLLVLIDLDTPIVNYVALVLFTLACLTDYWDGNLARERNEVTQLGKMLDPIADKMLISATLMMLLAAGHAHVIPAIAIVLREFAVSGLRQVAAAEGIVIAAVPGAKLKTVLQMVAVGLLLLHHDPLELPLELAGQVALWVAMAWTLVTGFRYFTDYFRGRADAGDGAA